VEFFPVSKLELDASFLERVRKDKEQAMKKAEQKSKATKLGASAS
jgi:hypothetical protein